MIRAKALKVLGKYLPIFVQDKTSFVKEYAGTWAPKAIDYNIIQLFNSNNMAKNSWCQLENCNDPLKKCFAAIEIVKLCKPVLLLYNPGFSNPC